MKHAVILATVLAGCIPNDDVASEHQPPDIPSLDVPTLDIPSPTFPSPPPPTQPDPGALLECEHSFARSEVNADGRGSLWTQYFATAVVSVAADTKPVFWIEHCRFEPPVCPSGQFCGGEYAPIYAQESCTLSRGGVFWGGLVWIDCGTERAYMAPGIPNVVREPYVPPTSLRVWRE